MVATARKSTKGSRKTRAIASGAKSAKKKRPRVTAQTLAKGQREISISEFFAKNRHLLGFDNPRKALLTTVKEAVDNALDACEEAGVLPDIHIQIDLLPDQGDNRCRVTVQDNGPGIVRSQIENIFGKLLYGSKFHRLKMSRGQQGIGISAAGMYGLMTTGKPMVITTRPRRGKPAHHVELAMDTTRNLPEVTADVETDAFPVHTGSRVSIELEGRYTRGRTSVDAYIEQTAIANPHARFTYQPPGIADTDEESDDDQMALTEESEASSSPSMPGRDQSQALETLDRTTQVGDMIVYPRTVEELPPEPREIKPHPRGVELGTLLRMLKQTRQQQLGGFLQQEFCRVSQKVSSQVCEKAGLTTRSWVSGVGHAQAEAIYKSFQQVRLMGPPLDCLTPIGPRQILAGLLKGVNAEFYTASTRPPSVYRGNPFQIEVGLAFGGDLPRERLARIIRFANRVPLLYQQSACALHRSALETNWRNYGVSQARGALPEAPLVVMIHMASVWVPFTSESKEAIADYDEIRKEMKLALQECGRKLASYIRRRKRIKREQQRRNIFSQYIVEVASALHTIRPDLDPDTIKDQLEEVAVRTTKLADEAIEAQTKAMREKAAASDSTSPDFDTIIVDEAIPSDAGEDLLDGVAERSPVDPAESLDTPQETLFE